MTTPNERRRNLIWGREMLEGLSQDVDVPVSWRGEAAELLNRYPPLKLLQVGGASDIFDLEGYDDVLGTTRALFLRVRMSEFCSAERRYSLLVVLRHFY